MIYSVTICEQKTKDCAWSGSFQHKLEHRCFQLWCLPAFLPVSSTNYYGHKVCLVELVTFRIQCMQSYLINKRVIVCEKKKLLIKIIKGQYIRSTRTLLFRLCIAPLECKGAGGGVLPDKSHMDMCRSEGYAFCPPLEFPGVPPGAWVVQAQNRLLEVKLRRFCMGIYRKIDKTIKVNIDSSQ